MDTNKAKNGDTKAKPKAISAEEAQRAIQADREARQQQCWSQIKPILDAHGCRIISSAQITTQGTIATSISIEAI